MKEQVAGFLFDRIFDRVVLIRKTHPEWQAGKFNAIGGTVEDGEYPVETMRREFMEEAGMSIYDWSLFCTLDDQRGWRVYFFFAVGSIDACESKTDEKLDIFLVDELPKNIIPNLRWLIPMALSMESERCDEFIIREYRRETENDRAGD